MNHENVMNPIDIYKDKAFGYIVMPFYEGGDLTKFTLTFCYENGQLNVDKFIRFAKKLLEAVDHIHKNGKIHRDLKLDNIFFRNNEDPIDFVIADAGSSCDIDNSNSQFRSTDEYKPPE